ncbi:MULTISPECIES: IS110 family transposase [Sporomusa]|uniref:IS110 family transposase ISCsa4 n=1 Tax=Sporomusa sphaeroides DSM 2875 TaxID=1337886 RepID=A0A1U7MA82_9FIRM|nr:MULTISPECIES: IS110 family transposase [Sporomusa]OLS54346.1 transposase IS116/IS110/IS902 family protein [Sporomusa sphaeroides DSM 2875]CVK21931.1 Transposase IS116/IS110/IS902 family protein [Sporomusa sphaeroides DSM 2875]
MKCNQNQRILQVSEAVLIVGIDVASEIHYARAFDNRGLEQAKVFHFTNDLEGFKAFTKWAEAIRLKAGKEGVIVGLEPTGHYWFNLAQYSKGHRMKIVLVNPFAVKRSKELDDNNPTKNDRKDPKTIALLVKDGRYMEPYIPEGVYAELRTAMNTRWQIVKSLNGIKNQINRWLRIYFPEFLRVFADWEGVAAQVILHEIPTPAQIIEKGVEGIVARWKQDKIRAVGKKRAQNLVEAAQSSTGISDGHMAATMELSILLEDYARKSKQYETVMELVEKLVEQIPSVDKLLKIKGLGLVTIAGFLAEVGDISRFSHPKQIQKFAGLNLKENSSGKHRGKMTISKRGRKRLRAILFRAMLPLVAKNAEFRTIHGYYTTRKNNPLKKIQSLILLCCKLIRVIYAVLTKGIGYEAEKLLCDMKKAELLAV